MRPAALRVIGVGNELRGDDAAGLLAARLVRAEAPAGVEVIDAPRDAAGLLAALAGADRVVLVDAIAGGQPGGVVRLEAGAAPLPPDWRQASSHGLGVAAAIELARALGSLPPSVVVYGIRGTRFGLGEEPSPAVRQAAGRVAQAIAAELTPAPAAGQRRRRAGRP